MSQATPRNPFPSSAVARFASLDAETLLTVSTDAVNRATALLDEYLAEGAIAGDSGKGRVVAVVGEYGTGKTHLALTMLHRLAMSDGVKSLYLDAPADSFLALYRERFIPRLNRRDVRRTIEEYYADIVAEDLEESELTLPLANELRSRSIEPLALVRRVGLTESTYQGLLGQKLAVVTEDPSFGVALSLFLWPEFEAAVWEWLCGNPPDSALEERGVATTINSDATALQAMGVIALLYGGQHRRFVVVFDEMEKILGDSSVAEQGESVLAAFKRMLEIFSQSGALLILCGLPDFLEALPADSRQRISVVINPTRLTAHDAVRFIEDVNERSAGVRTLKPFSNDVAAYLADLSGGNARRLVRLCFYAYAGAAGADTDVTRAIVREAAREQFEIVSQDDVRGDIVRVLHRNGWRFETNRALSKGKTKKRADYWIPVGDGGCAIFLTQSILQKADMMTLTSLSGMTVEGLAPIQIRRLLIINGYLSDEFRSPLEGQFDSIVTHSLRTFGDDLDAALQGVVARVEKDANAVSFEALSEKVDQAVRQNSQLLVRFDDLTERLVTQRIQSAVERGLTSVFSSLSGARPRSRFPLVDGLFDQVLRQLDELIEIPELFASRDRYRASSEIIDSPTMVTAMVTLMGLRGFVQAFRLAIIEDVDRDDRYAVEGICAEYDRTVRELLESTGSSGLERLVSIREASRPPRRNGSSSSHEVIDSVVSLGRDVYDAAIRSRRG